MNTYYKNAFEIVVLWKKKSTLGFKVKEVNVLAARKPGREQKFKGRGRSFPSLQRMTEA